MTNIKALLLAWVMLINPIVASDSSDEEAIVEAVPRKKRRDSAHESCLRNEHITVLNLSHADSLRSIDFLIYFPALTDLNLAGNRDFFSIRPLLALSLKHLNLFGSSSVKDIENIQVMTTLRSLELGLFFRDDNPCKSLDFLSSLTNLTSLNLATNPLMKRIKPICSLPNLVMLDLNDNPQVKDLKSLRKLTSLTSLNVQFAGHPSKEDTTFSPMLNFLTRLTNLREVTISSVSCVPKLAATVVIK